MAAYTKDVSTPCAAYSRCSEKWWLPRALMGGTCAMRKAGEKLLPKECGEDQQDYNARLNRSTLFNAFRKTVHDMTGRVFEKEVVIEKDVPGDIKSWCENVDLSGRHINVFARDVFEDGMQTGITFILTDMPPAVKREDGKPATIADEQAAKIRPYLVHIKCENLVGWQSEMRGGVETLTQIRIKECVTEKEGEWHEKEYEQIRVIMP